MKNTSVIIVSLVNIFMLLELTFANPVDHTVNSNFQDATRKTVSGHLDHGVDSTGSYSYTDFDTPELIDTKSPDYEKINEDFRDGELKLNSLIPTLESVSQGIDNAIPNSKPAEFEQTTIFKPDSVKTNHSDGISNKPDSLATASLITSLAPVGGGNHVDSLITNSNPVSVENDDSLLTTLEPDSFSTIQLHISGSAESDSLSTTSKSDSKRPGSLATTFKPDIHGAGDNKSPAEPVTKESKNGATGIATSSTIILFTIFFVIRTRLT